MRWSVYNRVIKKWYTGTKTKVSAETVKLDTTADPYKAVKIGSRQGAVAWMYRNVDISAIQSGNVVVKELPAD